MNTTVAPYIHNINVRSRSITLKINNEGQLVVTTPKRFIQQDIDQLIAQNQKWIEYQRQQVIQKKAFVETDTTLTIFGKQFLKRVEQTPKGLPELSIQGETILFKNLDPKDETQLKKYTERFLKRLATNYIVPRAHQLAKVMKVTIGTITLRQQKTRWGSCSSQGNLHFNWRLVHAPAVVIDYVIIHELAHRQHMNHSAAFWNVVAKYDPEHPKHRGWLKRRGMSVG